MTSIAVPAERHVYALLSWYTDEETNAQAYYANLHVGHVTLRTWRLPFETGAFPVEEFVAVVRDYVADKVRILFTDAAEREFGPMDGWEPELLAIREIGNAELAAASVGVHPKNKQDLDWARQDRGRDASQTASNPAALPAGPPSPPAPTPRRCALYRHFDADGVLLYIGITDWNPGRDHQHSQNAVWAEFAHRMESEWLADREAAKVAEIAAIEDEVPIFNKKHAPSGREERVRGYLAKHGRLDLLNKALA